MSFGHHTPESLLPRSDSKNPATTCKGITQNGRPCRRPLAASPSTSPAPSPSRGYGVLAVLQDDAGHHSNAAAFYCWQHQDQANKLVAADVTRTKLYPLKERSSIDTLVDRLGVLDLDEDAQKQHRRTRRKHGEHALKKRETMPTGWQELQSPLMTVPERLERPEHVSKPRPRPSQGRSNLKASFLCCLRADEDDLPPVRIRQDRKRPQSQAYQQPHAMSYTAPLGHTGRPVEQATTSVLQTPSTAHRLSVPRQSSPAALSLSSRSRPNISQPQTQSMLSLIPSGLPPQTIAALMVEVSRPLTDTDLKTSGYIYIFWLTPESDGEGPDSDMASTVLDDASPGRGNIQDQMLERYSSQKRASTSRNLDNQPSRTVLLKIGRAINVHRRMNQWQKQCGHNITLLRYYPNDQAAKSSGPDPTPLLPRVERLIQMELAGSRSKQEKCESCGREHREWFEVDASRKGIREVDECVRRWVNWGRNEGQRVETARIERSEPGGYY